MPERTKQDVKAHVKQLQELYYDKLDALAAAGDRPDHGRAAPWSVGGRVWIQLERESRLRGPELMMMMMMMRIMMKSPQHSPRRPRRKQRARLGLPQGPAL